MIRRSLSNLLQRLKGLPPITAGELTEDTLRRCMPKQDPLILEIGANDGSHTVWFKKLFPDATIHCFEPDPRAIARFKIKTAGLDAIHLHQRVISDREGTVDFYPSIQRINGEGSSPWDCSGSIHQPTKHLQVHPQIEFGQPIKVPSSTLDQWCNLKQISEIDFIWMDVQGAELDVIAGATEILRQVDLLYTEYSMIPLYADAPSLRQILAALPTFKPHIRYSNDILLRKSL